MNQPIAPSTSLPHSTRAGSDAARASLVARREWSFVALTGLLFIALACAPAAYAYLTTPSGSQFMGVVVNMPDHAQYFSWYREFQDHWLAANKLTPEANDPIFFNLLWLGMARLGNLLGVTHAWMYQALRVVAGLLFVPVLYRMLAHYTPSVPVRRTAFLIALAGSGLGWILIVLKYTVMNGELINPLDVYVAEGNSFWSLMGSPHFIAAVLYVAVFDLFLVAERRGSWVPVVGAGLLAQFLGWQHAYDLVIVYGVIGAYLAARLLRDRELPWTSIGRAVVIGALSVWPALYSVLLTRVSPIWEEVLAQFDNAGVFTPPPHRLPVLLGIPLLAAIATLAADVWRRRWGSSAPAASNGRIFFVAWFLISFVLVYLPVDYQIHLLNGWQIPIAALAADGLYRYALPALQRVWRRGEQATRPPEYGYRFLSVLFLLLILPTNLYLFAWRFFELGKHERPYTLLEAELEAYRWLDANADDDRTILSSMEFGQNIPAFTGSHAFLAHWAQTVDFFTKRDQVAQYYSGELSPDEADALMSQFRVQYVVYGPSERDLSPASRQPDDLGAPLFDNGTVGIYGVEAQP